MQPTADTDDFFQTFLCWINGSKKNSQQVQVEELNEEFWSLNRIFASIKMFSKSFKHWCFSNLSCLKPSLKAQILSGTGPLNLKRFRTVKPRTQLSDSCWPWNVPCWIARLWLDHQDLMKCVVLAASWPILIQGLGHEKAHEERS